MTAGFGSMATAGPWIARPTVFEFYVLPNRHALMFPLFEALLAASGAQFNETQANGPVLAVVLRAFSNDATSEKILFRDGGATTLPSHGAVMRRRISATNDRICFEQRESGSEWTLELDGAVVGHGGLGFHYNPPYGDVYMEIAGPLRRRGLGAFFVQELKRVCRELDGIPAARCDSNNRASVQTCQKPGLIPCGHLLRGSITVGPAPRAARRELPRDPISPLGDSGST